MSMVLLAAGMALSAASSIQQGYAQAKAANANADVYDLYAQQAQSAGDYEQKKLERQKRQMIGAQRARYAKAGVLINEGSPLEVMADTATQYELDIAANRYNTQVDVSRYKYMSEFQRSMSSSYISQGYTSAIGNTLLTAGLYGSKFLGKTTKG